jgi:hypothetical protein
MGGLGYGALTNVVQVARNTIKGICLAIVWLAIKYHELMTLLLVSDNSSETSDSNERPVS